MLLPSARSAAQDRWSRLQSLGVDSTCQPAMLQIPSSGGERCGHCQQQLLEADGAPLSSVCMLLGQGDSAQGR